jgi:hypothetical protein
MKESCEVFGETIEGDDWEDLRKKMLAKLMEHADQVKAPERELASKRIEAKLAAKQRL